VDTHSRVLDDHLEGQALARHLEAPLRYFVRLSIKIVFRTQLIASDLFIEILNYRIKQKK